MWSTWFISATDYGVENTEKPEVMVLLKFLGTLLIGYKTIAETKELRSNQVTLVAYGVYSTVYILLSWLNSHGLKDLRILLKLLEALRPLKSVA